MSSLMFFILVFSFIILIVALCSFASYKMKQLEFANKSRDDDMAKEMEQLKKRVQVLEQIVTDKNYQLNEEFNNL